MRMFALAVFALLMMGPATAQFIPKTVPMTNPDGKQVGTATFSGNRVYMRDMKGAFIATIETTEKGSTVYDPTGKVTDFIAAKPAK